jgi:branched-chain amino acid transport system ATP-binding protein
MSAPLLEVRDVSVRFGGLQALDAVSLEVERGEILALIGPNGAGKSTLLNVVSGALRANAGEVRFKGERIDGLTADAVNARGLARTFQGAEVLRGMTVRENVMAAAAARVGAGVVPGLAWLGPAKRALGRLAIDGALHLATVGLDALAAAPASSLTAGQQRLLAVARALATGAELLILDEPGAGLNATEKASLAGVIERVRRQGRTVVFVEHDLGLVGRLAERIVVLDHGVRIAAGPPHEVRSNPRVIEAYLGNAQIAVARAGAAVRTAAPLLEVRDVSVSYGGSIALDRTTVRVGEGEIVALVGANGAGKSTLLKAVAGVVAPQSGAIVLDGEDLRRVPAAARVRRGLSLAPEGRALFGSLSVRDNLAVGRFGRLRAAGLRQVLWPSGAAADALAAAIEDVFRLFPRLRERAAQLAGTLSGGEGQMLAIGRALVNQPRLLMLDEPSFGLAPQVAKEILEALPRLTGQGISVLLVEQNAQAALQISDRAYVLVGGRVAAEGPSAALAADPAIAQTYLGWEGAASDAAPPPVPVAVAT